MIRGLRELTRIIPSMNHDDSVPEILPLPF